MKASIDYIFTSERLGFRNWQENDIEKLIAINQDPEVMRYFPALPSSLQTREFILNMQTLFTTKGFCYFAVDLLENHEFLGFIGINEKDFDSDFTPCTDIGWRLKRSVWHNGYATEGAIRCLQYTFEVLGIFSVKSIAPIINEPSISVMKKIGINFVKNFEHPQLLTNDGLRNCVLYEINTKKNIYEQQ